MSVAKTPPAAATGPFVQRAPLLAGSMLFAVLWLWAAATKLWHPFEAYEFSALIVGGGSAAKAAVVMGVALEAALGAAILLRATSGLRESLLMLVVWTVLLHVARAGASGALPCGCFRRTGTIDEEITINFVLLGVVLALVVWQTVLARRGTRQPA